MTELTFPRLTPRLLLRPLVLDDRDAIHHLYRDWAVARWLSRLPWPFTPESAETLIAEAASDLERGRGLFLAVTHRTTGAFVGTLSLRLPAYDADPWTDDKRLGVLGYAIAHEQQGNGFASEAAASMVELAFTEMRLLRLRATVLRDNVASRRVLERLRFWIWRAGVREVPRYGGPPRLGDTFVLDRVDWIAADGASVARADAPTPPTCHASVSVPTLPIISGPIASGRSTVAQLLATESRASGHTVAVVDLDRLYMMLDHRSPMDDPRTWRAARRAAAALADQFLVDGAELVIVEGTFWAQAERDEFAHRLSTAFDALFVTLHVSVDEALTRVQADVGRRASRVPELLRASHAEFASAPSIAGDVTIDSTHANVMEVASLIRAALASQRGPRHAAGRPLFVDVDCVQIPVPDLDAGLAFYRDALGHTLIWRTHSAAGLRLADSSTELVIQTERPELEPNLTVASADAAAERFVDAGGTLLAPPFEIAIGRCAVVQDPWGNRLVVPDHSQGRLLTDASGRVRVGLDGRALTQFRRELPEARSDRAF